MRRAAPQGYVLILSLLVLTGLVTLTSVSMSRTSTELLSTRRFADRAKAFYLAEGGLDRVVRQQLTGISSATLNTLLAQGAVWNDGSIASSGTYTVTITDNDDGDGTLAADADSRVILIATGHAPEGHTQTLRGLIQIGGSQPSAFDFAVAASAISLSGNATLGSPDARIKLYLAGDSYATTEALDAITSDTIWASQVDFRNPQNQTLDALCGYCTNAAVFPVSPPPAPVFKTSGVAPLSLPSVDFNSYYAEALATDNNADSCQAYHYISAAPGTTVTLDGNACPSGLDGVIYVERGVNLVIKNSLTLRGTLVHEGLVSDGTPGMKGKLTLASNASLTIDSQAGFGKGMAIIGDALTDFRRSTIDINGFVMVGYASQIDASGIIRGAILGVTDMQLWSANQPGPERSSFTYAFGAVAVGTTTILFQPLTETPPGFPATGGSTQATAILVWQAE